MAHKQSKNLKKKNLTLLAILAALIVVLFFITIVKIKIAHG